MRLLLLYHDGGCEKPAWGKKSRNVFLLDGSRLEKVAKKTKRPACFASGGFAGGE